MGLFGWFVGFHVSTTLGSFSIVFLGTCSKPTRNGVIKVIEGLLREKLDWDDVKMCESMWGSSASMSMSLGNMA